MPHLLYRLSFTATFLLVLFGVPAAVSAASYFVAPNGGGSTCSSASPCSLNSGLDKAGSGDELILKDGTYRSTIFTKRAGVTIRAENAHQAIIEPPNGWDPGTHTGGDQGDLQYIRIRHSNVTVRGVVFDAVDRRSFSIVSIGGNVKGVALSGFRGRGI